MLQVENFHFVNRFESYFNRFKRFCAQLFLDITEKYEIELDSFSKEKKAEKENQDKEKFLLGQDFEYIDIEIGVFSELP